MRLLFGLIGLKISIIIVYLAMQADWSIGEQSLYAEEKGSNQTDNQPTKKAAKEADKVEEEPNTTALSPEKEEEQAKSSYLGELLFLPDAPSEDANSEELSKYQNKLARKKQQLSDRIEVLKKREQALKGIEVSIDQKLEKLEKEMKFFSDTQQKEKELQKERLDQLVAFYQKMAPKQAAPVIEKMDRDLVVALFKKFPQKQTQSVLALMNPEKAVELTEYFGRIKSAKEHELLKEINFNLREEFKNCNPSPDSSPEPSN